MIYDCMCLIGTSRKGRRGVVGAPRQGHQGEQEASKRLLKPDANKVRIHSSKQKQAQRSRENGSASPQQPRRENKEQKPSGQGKMLRWEIAAATCEFPG